MDLSAVLRRLGLTVEAAAAVIASAETAPPLTADQATRINLLFRARPRN